MGEDEYEFLVRLFDEHGHEVWNFGTEASSVAAAIAAAGIVIEGATLPTAVRAEITRGRRLWPPNP